MDLQLMRLRKEAGYKNRDDFAEKYGFNKYTYRSWENGAAMMSLQQACEICDILGCTLDELAGRTPPNQARDNGEQALIHDYRKLDIGAQRSLRSTASYMAGTAPSIEKKQQRHIDNQAV